MFCFSCSNLPNPSTPSCYTPCTIGKPSISRSAPRWFVNVLDLRLQEWLNIEQFCHCNVTPTVQILLNVGNFLSLKIQQNQNWNFFWKLRCTSSSTMGKPFMSGILRRWFHHFQTYGVQYIEFWVIFAIGNSNQVTILKGVISWVMSSDLGQLQKPH